MKSITMFILIIASVILSWNTNIWLSIGWIVFMVWVLFDVVARIIEEDDPIEDGIYDESVIIKKVKIKDDRAKDFMEWLESELEKEEKSKAKTTKSSKNIKYKKSNKGGK